MPIFLLRARSSDDIVLLASIPDSLEAAFWELSLLTADCGFGIAGRESEVFSIRIPQSEIRNRRRRSGAPYAPQARNNQSQAGFR